MKKVNGILLIYHHVLGPNAPTIMEHVNAFQRHSRFAVWKVNTELGFPPSLRRYRFASVVLHYSLFGSHPFKLEMPFYEYVRDSVDSYKIAFFQDEYRFWPERRSLLNDLKVNCVYTLVEPRYFDDTYLKYTDVPKLVYTIPGHVPEDAAETAAGLTKPDPHRTVDIGYRGRRGPYYLGRGAQEKHLIGIEFRKRAAGLGLRLDIETEEDKRIYGKAWPRFLANCRAVLGVEAGSSVFDVDNIVRPQCAALLAGNPDVCVPDCDFEEMYEKVLVPHEGKIYYRTISARHFEAAALRVCQILFEGKYSGILKPMVHYIPLKKDFSNFDAVIEMFRDERLRRELAENAYVDLIASGKYSYRNLIEGLDNELLAAGISPDARREEVRRVERAVKRHLLIYVILKCREIARQFLSRHWRSLGGDRDFPGKELLKAVFKPLFRRLGI